ncbi:MAG TPA: class I adenylate-forming enzyme family protein [Candidatus Wallbacteria bacterium]|nr:class I adenylate-forming enzyme family protein [Candidatus Wallbacteria bacterium]
MDICGLLEKYGSQKGPAVFIDYNGLKITYTDIISRSYRVSRELEHAGLKRGAVCALVCYNNINFILYFAACLKAGIIPIIINPKYGNDELQSLIDISEVKTIITDNAFAFSESSPMADGRKINIITPGLETILTQNGGCLYSDSLNDGTLFMLVTSASGGRPKIVKKNSAALSYQAEKLYPRIMSVNDTRYMANVPASHSYGLEFALFGSIYNGAPLYLRDFGFSSDVMDEIAFNEITHIFTIPPFILNLVNYKLSSGIGFDRLEMVVSAGMPLMSGLSEKFFCAFNFNIASVYGITEVGCVSFNPGRRSSAENCAAINNDVGFALEGNAITVIDDAGAAVRAVTHDVHGRLKEGDSDSIRENIGRVIIRKKIPDGGYYKFNCPEGEAKWRLGGTELETDDSGYIDPSGALHLLARSSAFVNIGGVKVNSSDVEAFLRSTGLFKDVLVFGRKDALLGEKLAAAMVVDEGSNANEDEIRGLCAKKLPPVKVPRDIYILKSPFPRTSTGKIRFDKVLKMVEETKDSQAAE